MAVLKYDKVDENGKIRHLCRECPSGEHSAGTLGPATLRDGIMANI